MEQSGLSTWLPKSFDAELAEWTALSPLEKIIIPKSEPFFGITRTIYPADISSGHNTVIKKIVE